MAAWFLNYAQIYHWDPWDSVKPSLQLLAKKNPGKKNVGINEGDKVSASICLYLTSFFLVLPW